MSMHRLARLWVAGLIAVGLTVPLVSFAALVPIGGKVTVALPCVGGGIYYVVAGFGMGAGAFVWYPGSITYPYGPPRPGVNILGTADVPVVCFFGKVPLYGLRTFMEGTSLAI